MDRQSYYYNLIISNATISPDSSPRTSFCTGRIWGAVCWCRWACWSRRRSPRSSPRARPAAGPGPRPGPGRAGAGAGCPPWGCRGSGWTARAATCSTNHISFMCSVDGCRLQGEIRSDLLDETVPELTWRWPEVETSGPQAGG